MNEPRAYDLDLLEEKERLLKELSGYLSEGMECRELFLNSGTDLAGRKYAIAALDELRRRRWLND